MKATGYQLREALRRHISRRDIAATQFQESLWQFKDEVERNLMPKRIADNYEKADEAIAILQSAQQSYNANVRVKVLDKEMPLAVAVKRMGGAGRLEKMWKDAATDKGRDRYSPYNERRRSKEDEFAVRQVSLADAVKFAETAARFASELRAAIAVGNSTPIEVDINPSLLE